MHTHISNFTSTEGLSDLIGSGCSIREAVTLHPAGGVFRNKREIKELSFSIDGRPWFLPWHPLCVFSRD